MERLARKDAIITGAGAGVGGAATWSAPHAHRITAGGLLRSDPSMAPNVSASKLVAKLLDLAAPMGAATSFIGYR